MALIVLGVWIWLARKEVRIRWWWAQCAQSGVSVDRHEYPEADHDLAFHQADLAKFPAWVRLKAK